MALLLNIGSIKDLENTEIKTTCDALIDVKEKIETLKDKLKCNNTVRIWFSSLDSEDYSFFLFVIYLINKINKEIKINIINVGTIPKNEKLKYGPYWSLGCFSPDEIKELLQFERTLTQEEINDISNEWTKLENENADLRIIENKKLKSVSYKFLDDIVLEELSKYKETDEIKLVAELMKRERDYGNIGGLYGTLIFYYRINELKKQNKIKVVRTRLELNAIKELEKRIVIKIVKE